MQFRGLGTFSLKSIGFCARWLSGIIDLDAGYWVAWRGLYSCVFSQKKAGNDGEVREFDEHSDDEGSIDERLAWKDDGCKPEHQRGIAGGGGHGQKDAVWVTESEAPCEQLTQYPSENEKQEDSDQNQGKGFRIGS